MQATLTATPKPKRSITNIIIKGPNPKLTVIVIQADGPDAICYPALSGYIQCKD